LVSDIISKIILGTVLYNKYKPRDTQIITVLLFLEKNNKGRLGNIYTGEGKSLITAILAIIFGLFNKKVDIVTSSKVLAVRDSLKRE
jgi:preprotein translocase subunit SecA